MGALADLAARFRREHVALELDQIQALILRARPEPYVGMHVMLRVDDPVDGRALLAEIVPHIASAEDWTSTVHSWTGIAVSFAGLQALGVPEASLASFPLPFQQGMAARAAQLRDTNENAPSRWEPEFQDDSCHLALTVYADSADALEAAKATMHELAARHGDVAVIGTQEFGVDATAQNPFGYRDSISQPLVAGAGVAALPGQERALAAGEFILGEDSENGEPLGVPAPAVLGRNGSYVVFRKYQSHVGRWNDYLRANADTSHAQDLLGAKMVGRWRSGAPLMLSPDADDPALGDSPQRNNAFSYGSDPHGAVCPYSSHSRRMNPRDSRLTILTDVNVHRIIRRSSTFGPTWDRELTAADDRGDRGIYFIFISARAFDTIEFLQQEWINRGNFVDLAGERDPVVGLQSNGPQTFTIPDEPVRHRMAGVPTFNTLRGGEYMFMPSLPALAWIAAAGWE